MKTLIKKKTTISDKDNLILLCDKKSKLSDFNLSKQELEYITPSQPHTGIYIIGHGEVQGIGTQFSQIVVSQPEIISVIVTHHPA